MKIELNMSIIVILFLGFYNGIIYILKLVFNKVYCIYIIKYFWFKFKIKLFYINFINSDYLL